MSPTERTQALAGARPVAALLPPSRVAIENVRPEIDAGRFPIKRVSGEDIRVTADIHTDGTAALAAALRWRRSQGSWQESPMTALDNDAWTAAFRAGEPGRYEYTVAAWVDPFASWARDMARRIAAGSPDEQDYLEGAALVLAAAERAGGDSGRLRAFADVLGAAGSAARAAAALDPGLAALMARRADHSRDAAYGRVLPLLVERERARYGAWYEMFPRSCGRDPKRGATLREAEARLAGIAAMGFDVLYLPPIHPIGPSFRKGPNNSLHAGPLDPGSPWAIGSSEGGHDAVHPALGSLRDFDHFVAAARDNGLEVALDLALQCSPDHPYLREHPGWFRRRPDGSVKPAENPPKKYEDIVPLDFDSSDWRALWDEWRRVVRFWVRHGVRIFRVDNPHTKPYAFWETLIASAQREAPDVVFLAEAFTRPKVMRYLAKCGFSQSYTYFTWRNTKSELTEYFTELNETEVREYLRPNLFANTPDILHAFLQEGGRPAHEIRLVLAATLGASYGIYGPPFELCEARAIPGSEDYADSEKYQIRVWDRDDPASLKGLIAKVNGIRRGHRALQSERPLSFLETDNEHLIAYAKHSPDYSQILIMVVNLDPRRTQSGWLRVPWRDWGLDPEAPHAVRDLLSEELYSWQGASSFIRLDPQRSVAHILRVERTA